MILYETAFLIAPNLPEEESENLVEQMAGVVAEKKGKMVELNNWGKRKTAYPIKTHGEATYVFFLYEGEPDLPAELERRFKQNEAIIRYMTIKQETKAPVRKKKKARTAKRERSQETRREAEEVPEEKTAEAGGDEKAGTEEA